jgi:hypothetical protein
VDLESGQTIKLNPWEVKKHYVSTVKSYFEDLKVKCAQYQIDLAEADINKDFQAVLLSYLVKRKRLY